MSTHDSPHTGSAPLLTSLYLAAQRRDCAFHTPGHRRGQGTSSQLQTLLGQALQADLPELPGLDNLLAPTGVIQAAQELAAIAFGAERTWFLANGSTSGVIAAIAATCNPGDKLVLPRNVHQSAISGLIVAGAVPIFVQPEVDPHLGIAHSVSPAAIAHALDAHPDAKAVLITYPTYYGVCGDITTIAQLCHHRGIPLLVDEAHGAHFAFHSAFPIAALRAGADIAVQSIHKTLPALTQAAMLHLQGQRIAPERISKALALVQSTSPNYLLLASLDAAREQMAAQGKILMEQALHLADAARSRLAAIPGLTVLAPEQAGSPGFTALDPTRLTVTITGLGIDGFVVDTYLQEQFGVIAELPSLHHLTFIITSGNTAADIDQLVQAFEDLSQRFATPTTNSSETQIAWSPLNLPPPIYHCTPREAFFAPARPQPVQQAVNQVSAELVCPYPPGIPVLIPGEIISEPAIASLQATLAAGGVITGCADPSLTTLNVLCQNP